MFSGGAKASAAPGAASASDPDAALADLWARLSSATADRAHKKALKLADAILELLPGDGDATRCKVVALIELERHRDAVAACERHGAPDDLAFERAYALYKSHDAPDALALLERVSSNPSRTQLRAQLLHRAGRAAESADAYADLFETRGALAPDASARSAAATNLVASLVAAGRSADVADALRSAGVSPKESHELAFNVACAAIETGDLADAAEYLVLARKLGEETLAEEESAGPDEIADELFPVDAQAARVAALRGRASEAATLYRAALATKSTDHGAVAVAANNLAALVGPRGEGGAEAMRRVEKFVEPDAPTRFAAAIRGAFAGAPARVRAALLANRAIACVHSNRLDRCRDSLAALAKVEAMDESVLMLLDAATALRRRDPKRAKQTLANRRGAAAKLALAQIAAAAGEHAEAVDALIAAASEADATSSHDASDQALSSSGEPLLSLRSPALVATVAALRELAGDAAGADAFVFDAASAPDASAETCLRAGERALGRGGGANPGGANPARAKAFFALAAAAAGRSGGSGGGGGGESPARRRRERRRPPAAARASSTSRRRRARARRSRRRRRATSRRRSGWRRRWRRVCSRRGGRVGGAGRGRARGDASRERRRARRRGGEIFGPRRAAVGEGQGRGRGGCGAPAQAQEEAAVPEGVRPGQPGARAGPRAVVASSRALELQGEAEEAGQRAGGAGGGEHERGGEARGGERTRGGEAARRTEPTPGASNSNSNRGGRRRARARAGGDKKVFFCGGTEGWGDVVGFAASESGVRTVSSPTRVSSWQSLVLWLHSSPSSSLFVPLRPSSSLFTVRVPPSPRRAYGARLICPPRSSRRRGRRPRPRRTAGRSSSGWRGYPRRAG